MLTATILTLTLASQNFGVYGWGHPDSWCLEREIPNGTVEKCYNHQPVKPQKIKKELAVPFIVACHTNPDHPESVYWCACMAAVAPWYKFTVEDLYRILKKQDHTELEKSASNVCLKMDKDRSMGRRVW